MVESQLFIEDKPLIVREFLCSVLFIVNYYMLVYN